MGADAPSMTFLTGRPGYRLPAKAAQPGLVFGRGRGWAGFAPAAAQRRSGFTLLELLLATVLILMLLGAAVFNFGLLQRGAALEEGASQFEALVRLARAQAAQTGRAVQINFEDEVLEGVGVSLGGVHVLWEPDPLEQPGCWAELAVAAPMVEELASKVAVWDVRTAEPGADLAEASPPEPVEEQDQGMLWGLLPPITFYPDGSSDSAEVTLVSRDADDSRQVALVIDGLTGRIWRDIRSTSTQTEGSPAQSGTSPTTPLRPPQAESASAGPHQPGARPLSDRPKAEPAVPGGEPRWAL